MLIWLLLSHGVSSALALPYQRLLPGFVDEILSRNADESAVVLGMLLTVTAVGGLAGSLLIASLPSRHRGRIMIASMALFSVALIAFTPPPPCSGSARRSCSCSAWGRRRASRWARS